MVSGDTHSLYTDTAQRKARGAEQTNLLALNAAVEAARAIEPLCILWCIPGFARNEWSHALKLLKK